MVNKFKYVSLDNCKSKYDSWIMIIYLIYTLSNWTALTLKIDE